MAAIPEVAADEAAAIEPLRRSGIDAIAHGAGEMHTVLEARGVGHEISPVVIRCAIGLESAEVTIGHCNQLVVGIALCWWDRQPQERRRFLVQLLRPPPLIA